MILFGKNLEFVEDIYQKLLCCLDRNELKDHNVHSLEMWFVKTIYRISSITMFEEITP